MHASPNLGILGGGADDGQCGTYSRASSEGGLAGGEKVALAFPDPQFQFHSFSLGVGSKLTEGVDLVGLGHHRDLGCFTHDGGVGGVGEGGGAVGFLGTGGGRRACVFASLSCCVVGWRILQFTRFPTGGGVRKGAARRRSVGSREREAMAGGRRAFVFHHTAMPTLRVPSNARRLGNVHVRTLQAPSICRTSDRTEAYPCGWGLPACACW